MNIYNDTMYSEVSKFDAVYENRAAYKGRKLSKNYRRAQRKAKQAHHQERYDRYDTF